VNLLCVKAWEIIADDLSKAGWSWGAEATVLFVLQAKHLLRRQSQNETAFHHWRKSPQD
jgi:hypothetical protein